MIIFDGKYSWDGTKRGSSKPVSWWPGAYWLKIIDLSQNRGNLLMLKPILVFAAETENGHCVRNRYQDLVKNVCRDFNLKLEKILWITYNVNSPQEIETALFELVTYLGSEVFFSVRWRPVLPNEQMVIMPYFPEHDNMDEST